MLVNIIKIENILHYSLTKSRRKFHQQIADMIHHIFCPIRKLELGLSQTLGSAEHSVERYEADVIPLFFFAMRPVTNMYSNTATVEET